MELKLGMRFIYRSRFAKSTLLIVSLKHKILEDSSDNTMVGYRYMHYPIDWNVTRRKQKVFLKMINDGTFKYIE